MRAPPRHSALVDLDYQGSRHPGAESPCAPRAGRPQVCAGAHRPGRTDDRAQAAAPRTPKPEDTEVAPPPPTRERRRGRSESRDRAWCRTTTHVTHASLARSIVRTPSRSCARRQAAGRARPGHPRATTALDGRLDRGLGPATRGGSGRAVKGRARTGRSHGGDTSSGTRGVLRRVGPFLFARVFVAAVAFPALVRGPALAAGRLLLRPGARRCLRLPAPGLLPGLPRPTLFLGPAPAFVLALLPSWSWSCPDRLHRSRRPRRSTPAPLCQVRRGAPYRRSWGGCAGTRGEPRLPSLPTPARPGSRAAARHASARGSARSRTSPARHSHTGGVSRPGRPRVR